MTRHIHLGRSTLAIRAKLPDCLPDGDRLSLDQLEDLLQPNNSTKKNRLSDQRVQLALLKDLYRHLKPSRPQEDEQTKQTKPSWWAKLQFGLLLLAGTIYFACEGFDGIVTLLGAFSVPTMVTLGVGLAFALLSVLVFYASDLMAIAETLKVGIHSGPKLVNLYLQEARLYKKLRKAIEKQFLNLNASTEDCEDYQRILKLINPRRETLYKQLNNLQDKRKSPWRRAVKLVAGLVIGIIFFSAGFFIGQTVALFALGLFISNILPTFWPVMLIASFVGLTSFGIYWFTDRSSVDKLASYITDIDEAQIDECSNRGDQKKETEKSHTLETSLERFQQRFSKEQRPPEISSSSLFEVLPSPSQPQDSLHEGDCYLSLGGEGCSV